MEVAKKELQSALRPIRGRRVDKAELDALAQKTLDRTKAKVGGASVPNTTWEYLLKSEILSLAVRRLIEHLLRIWLSMIDLKFVLYFDAASVLL